MLANTLREYSRIGVRVLADDENYSVGETCRRSYDWDYENDCSTFDTENPIKLNGTCAMELLIDEEMTDEEILSKINEMACNYGGEQIVMLGGYDAEYGADENEIIIANAVVLKVL